MQSKQLVTHQISNENTQVGALTEQLLEERKYEHINIFIGVSSIQ